MSFFPKWLKTISYVATLTRLPSPPYPSPTGRRGRDMSTSFIYLSALILWQQFLTEASEVSLPLAVPKI